MAEKSDGDPKDTNLGEREQFDSFDRLQKVDQKNLNVDKLKATDKDSDSEELLATKERTHYDNIKEEYGTVKFTNTNFQLDDNYKIEHPDITPIEDSVKSASAGVIKTATGSSNQILDVEFRTAENLQTDNQASNIEYVEAKIANTSENQLEQGPLPIPITASNTVPPSKPSTIVSQKEGDTNSTNNFQAIEEEKPLITQPSTNPETPTPPTDNGNANDQFLVQLPNGNYKLIPGAGFSLTLDSISSDTIYDNTFGHYFADINGNPISGSIDFTNVKQSLGVGDAITITYGPGDIPPGAVTIGFFIIPNGDPLNPLLPEGANVTFSLNAQGQWVVIYNGIPINGEGAPVYFSDPTLNSDNQFQHSQNGNGQVSFEDSFGGVGSDGYNDVVVNTRATLYTGPNTGSGGGTGTGDGGSGTGTGGGDGGTGTGGGDGGTGTGGGDGGTGTGDGNSGGDHDNGHGNDDDHNDDSNPGNGGGNHGSDDNPPTPPVPLPNGNYNLIPGQGFSLTIDSIDSNAGYNNSFGHYFADGNGNPISGTIDFTNVKNSLGIGDTITINYGPGDIPQAAVTIGFFIIPNGNALNPLLPEGANVTFSLNDQGQWTAYYNSNPINGEGAPAYFSDPNLNPDGGATHSNNNAGQISFEDLFGGSSDGDYNDVVVNVQFTSYTGPDIGHGDNNTGGNNGDGGTGTGGGDAGKDGHDNGHGNDDDRNDDSNPGNGGRNSGRGKDDHDNGHGNDDDRNDDSNPSNGGRNNNDGGKNGRGNNRSNDENVRGNDNSKNLHDINSEKENNSRDSDNHDSRPESGPGKNDNSHPTVNDHSHPSDTNISAMDSHSWTDIVSKDSDASSTPSTANWLEQVDIKHETDIAIHNDKGKGQEQNNNEDAHHEVNDDSLNNDDKHSSNSHHF